MRFVGYFPTVELSKVLAMPYLSDPRHLWRLRAMRHKDLEKKCNQPETYFSVTEFSQKEALLNYNWLRNGNLRLDQIRGLLDLYNVDEMNVEELTVGLPSEIVPDAELLPILPEGVVKAAPPDTMLACTFKRTKVKGDKDKESVKLTVATDFTQLGGKFSSLDLAKVEDMRLWAKGYGNSYELNDWLVATIVYTIAPDLATERIYKRKTGDIWEMVEDKRVSRRQ